MYAAVGKSAGSQPMLKLSGSYATLKSDGYKVMGKMKHLVDSDIVYAHGRGEGEMVCIDDSEVIRYAKICNKILRVRCQSDS